MADNFTLCLEKMHFEISVLRCQFIRRFKRTCYWPYKNSCSQVTTALFLRLSLNWIKGGRIYVLIILQFSLVQSLSRVQLFATPWIAARQASLSITNSRSSLRLTSIESVMPSSHLILCRPLLLLPPNPSQHQSLFQWVNSSHDVAKVLEFEL